MALSDGDAPARRILLRTPKDTFQVASPEQTVDHNLIATNSGNLIFLGASQKILGAPGVELTPDRLRIDPSAAAEINERYDAYVIPLANAFRIRYEAHLVQMAGLIRRLTIPVTILGVGVDGTIAGDTSRLASIAGVVREFVAAVLDHGPSIGVRGEVTADFVRSLGFRDVEVIGCPSMFLHGSRLSVVKREPALSRASPLVISISPYLQAMGPVVQHHLARYPNLTYVAQDMDTLEMLVLGVPPAGSSPDDAVPRHPEHPLVRDGRARLYIDPWPWIADLRQASFVFGSRIHGTIAALVAGTPAYLLAHDARTVELARYFDIPHRSLRDMPADTDASELYAAADYGPLATGHPARWDRFAAYLAAHHLDHVFDHQGAAEAFDRRVAATPYPPAVTVRSAADHATSGIRGLARRLQVRIRRRLRQDDVRRLRTRAVRLFGGIADTGSVQRIGESPPAAIERRLLVSADVDRLAEVRAFVRRSVAELGGSSRVADDLVQATDEATCNVILHGYAGEPGEIELRAALRDQSIEVTIADRAPVFDPTGPPDPEAAKQPRRPGTAGVGLMLARTMADEVRHHVRPDGGNELTLVRSIDGPAEEG